MEKKNFKVYEAPEVEIVEMEVAGAMLAGSEVKPGDGFTDESETPW